MNTCYVALPQCFRLFPFVKWNSTYFHSYISFGLSYATCALTFPSAFQLRVLSFKLLSALRLPQMFAEHEYVLFQAQKAQPQITLTTEP
jgi:hypothetical protein